MIINKTIYKNAPIEKRTPPENETYRCLDELGIIYERIDHDPAMTISDCEEIDSVLNVSMCKNLFLCNSSKTKFYLLMMPGNKVFKTKDVSSQLGISRLSFAPGNYMEQLLHLSPGSVSVMGLIYDNDCEVTLLMDKDLCSDEYIGCHPCVNTSSLKISTKDILNTFLPYVKHTPIFIDIK